VHPPRFIDQDGRRLLLLDLAHASPAEKAEAMRSAAELIAAEPPGSVLLLIDVTGAGLSDDVEEAVREFAERTAAHVRARALVGASGLKRLLYARLQAARGGQALFDDLEVARAWLARQ
jgi:hypothetical protein